MPRRTPLGPEDALARVVLDRYLSVRRGELVTVESWSHALSWARAFVVEARRRGAAPTLLVEDESAFFRSVREAGSASVMPPPSAWAAPGALVYLPGPEEFPRLLGLPPDDLARIRDRHPLGWWRAARRARTRAVRVALPAATPEAASRYGVDLAAWQAELLRASRVDPQRLGTTAARFVRALGRARRLWVRHANGTDLHVQRARRPTILEVGRPSPSEGRVWGQVPAGLLIVPIDPRRTQGRWECNRPVYDRFARPPVAVGGRFDFTDGRLRQFGFDRGGEPLSAAYTRAGLGRDRATALTIGLNPEVRRAPEVLEMALGTVGLFVGDAPTARGRGRSRFSILAPLAEADLFADEEPVLTGGAAVRSRRG
jgi:leucyl aminopeptidase (aminopeptidase T)